MHAIRAGRASAFAAALAVTLLVSAVGAGAASAEVSKTFSFIAAPSSRTKTIVNINSLLINARCNSAGEPVVFAFSSASAGDLLGRVFDGVGRTSVIHNTSFSKGSKGVLITPPRNDFDATGTVLFESLAGQVVQVTYAADNSTTLNRRRVCTVYGSYIAS